MNNDSNPSIQEQEQLLAILKFTPRTYRISLWGYGGERVMGRVDPKTWDYCINNSVDISDCAHNSEAAEDMGLDISQLPFTPGQWYECDSMAHTSGVDLESGTLQIENENGEIVYERTLEDCTVGDESSPRFDCFGSTDISDCTQGDVVFIGSSNEKGTFFEGDIELTQPFDITQLVLSYESVDGQDIVNTVYYNGEEIDNYGYSTTGKSSDFTLVRVTDDKGTWERYEPREKDWGHPECGPGPDDWEMSPEFTFKKHKPVYAGYYRCVWSNYGTTYGTAYWNGKEFGIWEYGVFNPINSVLRWQGYNWDTSNWDNQPIEPPQVHCKKCLWTGVRDDMSEDDNYNYICPNCEAKHNDLEWLSYDPDTREGRANRKKYIEQWDPAAALEAIIATPTREELEQALTEFKQDPRGWPY